jgi:uncharacterized protein (TIGR03435 family)
MSVTHMLILRKFLLLLALFGTIVDAQAPSFEVASVKENKLGGRGAYDRSTPGRFTARNAILRNIIMSAYEIDQRAQLIGGPGWIETARFDIEAKAAGEADKPAIHRMLQSLLEERFKLAAHRAKKEMPVYFLVAAKNGPKIHDRKLGQGPPPNEPGMRRLSVLGTVAGLTHLLSNMLERPVIDQTGITGSHDWSLKLRQEDLPEAAVFAALEEQLGLKMEAAKAAVDVVVIDHIEKPSAN